MVVVVVVVVVAQSNISNYPHSCLEQGRGGGTSEPCPVVFLSHHLFVILSHCPVVILSCHCPFISSVAYHCHCCPHSTHNPPNEQWLMRLGVGDVPFLHYSCCPIASLSHCVIIPLCLHPIMLSSHCCSTISKSSKSVRKSLA